MAEKIELIVTLDNGQLKVATAEAKSSIAGIGKGGAEGAAGIGKMTTAARMFNTVLKASIIIGIVSAIYKLGKTAIKMAAEMEQNTIAFKTMLGSASKAKSLLKDITTFAAKTPFEIAGLVNTTKTLLSFRIEQEKIIPIMKELGNASLGNQEKLQTLAEAYGRMSAMGKTNMEQLNRFIEAGVPILSLLAEEMGVNETAIMDLSSKGKISFETLQNAIKRTYGEGGKMANLLEEQSKSLTGLFSTFKDDFMMILLDVGQKLSPAIKDLLKSFTSLGQGTGIVSKLFNATAFAAGKLISGLATIANSVGYLTAKYRELDLYLNKSKMHPALYAEEQKKLASVTDESYKKMMGSVDLLIQPYSEWNKEVEDLSENLDALAKKPSPQGAPAETGKAGKGKKERTGILARPFWELTDAQEKELENIEDHEGAKSEIIINAFEAQTSTVLGMAQDFASRYNAIEEQRFQNEQQRWDMRYAFAKGYIIATTADEEERNRKLEEMDKIQEIHKIMMMRKEAKRAKDLKIAEATINAIAGAVGALGAMSAIPIVGPFIGIAMGAVILGLGMAQVAMISAAPIPMFEQGVFDVPKTTPAVLHGGESVLTKPITESLKSGDISLSGPGGGDNVTRVTQLVVDGKTLAEVTEPHRTEKARSMGVTNYGEKGVYS